MRTLIVEDDALLGGIWHEVLVDAGHEAIVVDEAGCARKLLLTHAFDAVVLDLMLGEDSGLSVAALANYANPDCCVVVVTGSALFARGELFGMAPNITSVLRKPVSIFELLAVIEYETGRGHRTGSRQRSYG